MNANLLKAIYCLLVLSLALSARAQIEESDVVAEEMGRYVVSLHRVISNPEEFHDKKINSIGYLLKQGKGLWYLFLDKGSCDDFIITNSVYIKMTEEKIKNFESAHPDYDDKCIDISVFGVFSTNRLYGNHLAAGHVVNVDGQIKDAVFY